MQTLIVKLPDDCDATEVAERLIETIGYVLHEQALAKKEGAEFHNVGWGVSGDEHTISIASKTSHGILQTDYDSRTGEVSNTWTDEG